MPGGERAKWLTFFAVIWGMALVTYATHQVFDDITLISGAAATAYTALIGIPATVWGWFTWARSRDGRS